MRYEDMENENYKNILRSIEYDLQSPSRAEIAKHLALSRAAVTVLVNSLISFNLVTEDNIKFNKNRGRPGSALAIDGSFWQVLGASLHEYTWQFVITNLSGNILMSYEREVADFSSENMIKTLVEGLCHMIANWKGNLLPGIGIGVPGVIDSINGDIVLAYDFNWTERINISKPVEEATGFKSFIMNRFTLEGIAEYKYANPEKIRDFIYIGVGSGIRSAIIADGNLIEGSGFSAGRLSHIQIDKDGDKCICGRTGCLFTLASENAILKRIREFLSSNDDDSPLRGLEEILSAQLIAEKADSGDKVSRLVLEQAAKAMAKAVVVMSDLLNPRIIVIGGQTGDSEFFISVINNELEKMADKNSYYMTPNVRRNNIKSFASALGAASLVCEKKLELLLQKDMNNKD